MKEISLIVNGRPLSGSAEPRMHLADFLREGHNLTGTHLGCEHGVCGACTVLADGVPVRSCITLAVACNGSQITTIEGLDEDEIMRELRDAFTRHHALQCGYCTPGMLISARDLVIRSPTADQKEIRIAMSGNLCRCTGYAGIVRAIKNVIADRRARSIEPIDAAGRNILGPAGSGHAVAEVETAHAIPAAHVPQPQWEPGGFAGPSIDSGWTPQVSFDQGFVVSFPRAQVWDMFGRVAEVASCLPGASLIGEPAPNDVKGQIRVKVGPIAAEFRGEARIERDLSSYSGRIIGAGSDARSSSTTRGLISYRLLPAGDGQSTEVAMTIGYTLTGMLAQFGRSGIVKDVAARLIAAFAQNLEARLAGKAGAGVPAAGPSLNAASLILAIIAGRLKSLLRSLLGRR
jgi:aerobic carbon-monoxide dehydrogenase small subunit